MVRGIAGIPGLYVVGTPDLSVIGVGGTGLDIFAVGEQMGRRGWFVSTMSDPPGIHLGMLTLAHVAHLDEYLRDLAASTDEVRAQNLKAHSHDASYGG